MTTRWSLATLYAIALLPALAVGATPASNPATTQSATQSATQGSTPKIEAAKADEVAELRQALDQTRALVLQLQSRLQAIEARADALQARADASAAAGTAGPPREEVAAAPAASGVPSSPGAFNPAISAVLQGSYNAYSTDPDGINIAGFAPPEEARLPNQGFSLGESEVTLAANADQMFYGALTVALDDDAGDTQTSIEEAYIETLALPYGAKIKAGRMFPVLGYLNEIHAHADAFVDRPLPYRAYFGGDNYRDDGIQLTVLLPTDFYAEIGAGAYRGIGYPAGGSANDGNGSQSLFARVGGDIGDSQSWVAGLSFLHAEARDRESEGLVFNGTTPVYTADFKYTWAPGGNMANEAFVLQGEYFWSRADGTYNGVPYDEGSSGWYSQGVYKFARQWKTGLRYARMTPGDVPLALVGTALDGGGHDPHTLSWLLEYDFSEFSNLRLQFTQDDSSANQAEEAFLLYTISLGAHGAHQY